MESILNNDLRIGRFTSSEVVRLLGNGKREMTDFELKNRPKGSKEKLIEDVNILPATALTYIEEKNFERKLKRSLGSDTNAKATTWGLLVEQRVFDLLGIEYTILSNNTIKHSTLGDIWCGTPDLVKHTNPKTVGEIKCPFTLKSFCTFAECNDISEVREKHQDGEKYYWQIVSNAILTDSERGELIIYCPKQSELDEIRQLADNGEPKFLNIHYSLDCDIPYLPENSLYDNMYIFNFEIPKQDKEYLENRIKLAGNLLINT